LGHFGPAAFIGNAARAGFRSMVQYTNSHEGLCLWNASVVQKHANVHGRDFFGEVVRECHRSNIHPLASFSVIFDNWNFEAILEYERIGNMSEARFRIGEGGNGTDSKQRGWDSAEVRWVSGKAQWGTCVPLCGKGL
jgi:hypothetical protein